MVPEKDSADRAQVGLEATERPEQIRPKTECSSVCDISPKFLDSIVKALRSLGFSGDAFSDSELRDKVTGHFKLVNARGDSTGEIRERIRRNRETLQKRRVDKFQGDHSSA